MAVPDSGYVATTHIPAELLAEEAAGVLAPGPALALACHRVFCAECRRTANAFTAVGGAHLENSPVASLPPTSFETLWSRIQTAEAAATTNTASPAQSATALQKDAAWVAFDGVNLPAELARCVPPSSRWRFLAPGIRVIDLSLQVEGPGATARLLRFAPGAKVPLHGHPGDEHIVVFSGGVRDARGDLHRGDYQCNTADDTHEQSILPGEPCVALVISAGPLRPLTWLGRVYTRIAGQ